MHDNHMMQGNTGSTMNNESGHEHGSMGHMMMSMAVSESMYFAWM